MVSEFELVVHWDPIPFGQASSSGMGYPDQTSDTDTGHKRSLYVVSLMPGKHLSQILVAGLRLDCPPETIQSGECLIQNGQDLLNLFNWDVSIPSFSLYVQFAECSRRTWIPGSTLESCWLAALGGAYSRGSHSWSRFGDGELSILRAELYYGFVSSSFPNVLRYC